VAEIESECTRRRRERKGAPLRVKVKTTPARQNLLEWRRGRPAYHHASAPLKPILCPGEWGTCEPDRQRLAELGAQGATHRCDR